MPVIRSAKKKLRVDKKRESANKKMRSFIDLTIKKAEKKPTPASVSEAFKVIDKSVKKDIMHKNKASRLKSRLSKLISEKTPEASIAKSPKKSKK
ncbi:MAG: 30S ribosomal protein S20 [Candidatus Parcubacteria bacterium]|nr:30S ribosomal protein S20 [Candidatus Parcubacteria bacterium]